MNTIGYALTAGEWSVRSADDPKTELVELETLLSLDAPGEVARVVVHAPPPPQAGLLEQVIGAAVGAASSALGLGGDEPAEEPAFGVAVRGQQVRLGDRMTIALAVDGTPTTIVTAEIAAIHSDFGRTTITGRTAMQRLARARLNEVYQNQSLGQIVRDLAGQVGVATGDVEAGSSYPYLVVHESKTLLRTLRELAGREGLDLSCDPEGRLTVTKFAKTAADHTLYYGIDLLDLAVLNRQPASEHVRVYGESPASNQGAETWHWLTTDSAAFRGEAGREGMTLAFPDGAVRTKAAAAAAAVATAGAITDRAALGRLTILGRPSLRPGDAIELKSVPKPELNGLFKVVAVRHRYSKRDGYLTSADFTGHGGADKAGDLLGQLAGALSGIAGGLGL